MKSNIAMLVVRLVSLLALGVAQTFAVTNQVDVFSNFYSPARLTNHVGDTILFVRQSGSHTVTGEAPEAFCGSGAMPASCPVTFANAGTFRYRCLFHSSSFTLGMVGSVTVLPVGNTPPSVAITNPPNTAIFAAPASFTLEASASDSDGISKVEFFQDGMLIGTDANAPYSQAVSGLAANSYAFSVVATDTQGATATNSITIIVYAPPLLSASMRGPAGKFRFDITSKAGQPIVIQGSGDLTAWQDLKTTNAPTDKFTYMDESATNINIRFYRTRTP